MLGVNLSGGEYWRGGNIYGTSYIFPSKTEIDFYSSKGMDVIRVPFQWERMQPALNGALDSTEVGRLKSVVSYANSKGMAVVLDAHDYGMRTINGQEYKIGIDSQAPASSLADFWGRMAATFKGSNVLYNIMNEPHYQSAHEWLPVSNAAIRAIRDAGATEKILVPGTYWTGAHSWISTDNDTVIGLGTVDPKNNYAFDVHQYLDSDSSGTSPTAVSTSIGVERLTKITAWARANNKDLFLGEFGAANNTTALTALDRMVDYMDDNADVWIGATYWAGGPWWGDYMFSIEPTDLATKGINATDRPQMNILEKYDLAASGAIPTPAPTPAPTPPAAATLVGTEGDNRLTGTAGVDVIDGLGGHDTLDGKASIDTLRGGSGNDTYFIESTGDAVVELAGQGTELVKAYTTYTLPAHVENINLLGSARLGATGNDLGNDIRGNAANNTIEALGGADILRGGGGIDRLTGGAGKDAFVFDTPLSATANVDTVRDFNVVDDTIRLENAIFTKLAAGTLASGSLRTGPKAADSNDYVLYDAATGALSYDADGSGGGAAVKFAQLASALALTSADIVVI
jgi:endoglucanase